MKQETAIEWLEKEILKYMQGIEIVSLFEQAKELDKEQELKKWIEAWSLGYDSGFNNCMKKFNNKQHEKRNT
jgi:hypothetical protein